MKRAVLLAAPGAATPRQLAHLRSFERRITETCVGVDAYWTFTSEPMRRALTSRGTTMPAPEAALDDIAAGAYDRVVVAPLHVGGGTEYGRVVGPAAARQAALGDLTVMAPVLASGERFGHIVTALLTMNASTLGDDEALILMAHGSDAQEVCETQRRAE